MKVLVLDSDKEALDFVKDSLDSKLDPELEIEFRCVDGMLGTECVIRKVNPRVLFLGVDDTNGDDGLFIAQQFVNKIEVYLMSDYLTREEQRDLVSLVGVPCIGKIPFEIQKIIELDL